MVRGFKNKRKKPNLFAFRISNKKILKLRRNKVKKDKIGAYRKLKDFWSLFYLGQIKLTIYLVELRL
jgi:hypothetical protein